MHFNSSGCHRKCFYANRPASDPMTTLSDAGRRARPIFASNKSRRICASLTCPTFHSHIVSRESVGKSSRTASEVTFEFMAKALTVYRKRTFLCTPSNLHHNSRDNNFANDCNILNDSPPSGDHDSMRKKVVCLLTFFHQ